MGDNNIRTSALSKSAHEDLKTTLLEIWEAVLGRSPVETQDDFFELGGDSLLAAQIIVRIEKQLNVRLTSQEFLEKSTISELADYLPQLQDREAQVIRASRRTGPVPVSDMQEAQLGRLAEWKLLPLTHPQQNICLGYRITGALDEEALRRSIECICQRHEIFRTHFDITTSPPTQVIEQSPTLDYAVIDLSESDEERREISLSNQIKAIKQQPFDCLNAALIRFHLLRLAPTDFVFIITTDHLIMDLWSIGLLQDEISECYSSFSQQQPYAPDPPDIQYADFSIWQRDFYPQKEQQALTYWRAVLTGLKSRGLEIPLSLPRPEKFEYRTAARSRDLTPLREPMRRFCENHRVTAFSFCLSVYVVLLYKLSLETSMLVVVPSAQRNRIELERVMGRFARSLVLRVNVNSGLPFEKFVGEVAAAVLAAQSNLEIHNVVFNGLLPAMVYGEDQHRSCPISYVGFSFDRHKQLKLASLDVRNFPVNTASGPWFDLNARILTRDDETCLYLIYNPDSYTSESSQLIVELYEEIMRAALRHEQVSVDDLVSLTTSPLDYSSSPRGAQPGTNVSG